MTVAGGVSGAGSGTLGGADEGGLTLAMLVYETAFNYGQFGYAAAISLLRNPAAEVSSHYVVEESGRVLQLVPESRRAWHAGASCWRGERVATTSRTT